MKTYVKLALIFVATLILSFLLYYSGIWLLAVLAGLIPSLVLADRYSTTIPVSFASGVASSLLFLAANYLAAGAPLFRETYSAGAIAGTPGEVFFALTLLLSGLYCALGSAVGAYLNRGFTLRRHT